MDKAAIYILGNGPSLRGFDFHNFKGNDCVGMNVAYRHWHRINWYPKYYTCLDTVMIEQHHKAIQDLVLNFGDRITLFFLRKNLLKFCPDLKGHPQILFFDDYIGNPFFDDGKKLTTGSFACLFAAMLGYRKIYLLGIDQNLVEKIPEAKHVGGHILEITETPKHNPNYFIDDYQQKGEKFNIPNSLPNLHYESWVLVKERLERFEVSVQNCSTISKLDLFPFKDFSNELSESNFSILPTTQKPPAPKKGKVVFYGINIATGFSGGRYHAWMIAEAAAEMGWDVSFITNNYPPFYYDFGDEKLFPAHFHIRMFICPITHKDCKLPDIPCDILIFVPHQNCHGPFTDQGIQFAKKTNARIALLNFETPNWFNALSPVKRDENIWAGWIQISQKANMIFSLAKEGTKYAKEFYKDIAPGTIFTELLPTINTRIADSTKTYSKEKRIILFIRFAHAEHKGADLLLELFCKAMKGSTLVLIVGVGEISQSLLNELNKNSLKYEFKFEILKNISEYEKWEQLKRASLILYPSFFEGFGLPPVEAQYVGTPCIAFDLPVLREISGNGIIYVKRGSIEEMKNKIGYVLNSNNDSSFLIDSISSKINYSLFVENVENFLKKLLSISPHIYTKMKFIKGISIDTINHLGIFNFKGWALYDTPITDIKVEINDKYYGITQLGITRNDVFTKYPDYNCKNAGFVIQGSYDGSINDNIDYSLIFSSDGIIIDNFRKKFKYVEDKCADIEYLGKKYTSGDTRKPIVVLTHISIFPCIQGNRIAVKQMIDWLKKIGERVFLVVQINPQDINDYIHEFVSNVDLLFIVDITVPRNFRKKKINNSDRFYQGTEDCLIAIEKQYGMKAIIAVYIHMTTAMELLPNTVLKMVQTIDVHSRFQKEVIPYGIDISNNRICTEEQEVELLNFADIVIAIQNEEKKIFEKMVPDRQVITVGLAADDFAKVCKSPPEKNKTILYVASGNPLNKHGLESFLKSSWKKVYENVPGCRLDVVGGVCEIIEKQFKDTELFPHINFHGKVDNIYSYYDNAALVINCTVLGTGLKIKSIEAISSGKAMVTTKAGVEGIYLYGEEPFIVVNDWNSFADAVIFTLNNPSYRKKIEQSAIHYTKSYLNYNFVYSQLLKVLNSKQKSFQNFTQAESNDIKKLTFELMESQLRIKLVGKIGVCITKDYLFSKYVITWLKNNSLNICGIYTDNHFFYNQTFLDISIKPINSAQTDGIELILIPVFDKNEIEYFEYMFASLSIITYNFFHRTPLNERFKMKALRNIHYGKTAFILGNGPSVRLDDLDLLSEKFIIFAANRFYMAYDRTVLRPDYTASADMLMIEQHGQEIAKKCGGIYFVQTRGYNHLSFPSNVDNIIQYDIIPRPKGTPPQVAFTEDASEGLGNGASIVYDLIQIAVWMGIKKLFLYGIDHSFNLPADYQGKAGQTVKETGEENHFLKNYRDKNERWYSPVTNVIDKAFSVAKEYCENNNVEIYNATRGGYLEIFKRVDFDKIVSTEQSNTVLNKNLNSVSKESIIVYYPYFSNIDTVEMNSHYHRAKWYFPKVYGVIDSVVMFTYPGVMPCGRPEYMCSPRQPANILLNDSISDMHDILNNSRVIMIWRKLNPEEEQIINHYKDKARYVITNDPDCAEYGRYCDLHWDLDGKGRDTLIADSLNRFKNLQNKCLQKNYNASVIFCTGPSIDSVFNMDLSGCFKIVCNSIVGNMKLMDYIQPDLICAGDVVSHFGISIYAEKFRDDLSTYLLNHDAYFFTTARFGNLFRIQYPELEDKIILCDQSRSDPNFNLLKRFQIPCLDSVLNVHMLPVAATFFDNIYIVGADGKSNDTSLNEDFWPHSKNAQYHDLVHTGHLAHPTFDINRQKTTFNRYINSVQQTLDIGEKKFGKRYYSLTHSFTPGLKERYNPNVLNQLFLL